MLEPDENVRHALLTLLRGWGWTLETANDVPSLQGLLAEHEVAAVISEASLPGCPASEVLRACANEQVPVVFTGHDLSAQDAVDLIRQGGYNYLEKPFRQERMMELLSQLSNRRSVK